MFHVDNVPRGTFKKVIIMYRNVNAKFKQTLSDMQYNDMFMLYLTTLFKYDDKIFRPEMLEFLLHTNGIAGLIKTDTSPYTPVIVNLAGGDRYADGLFKTAVCFDGRANQYVFEDWRNNRNIIIIFNNPFMLPDSILEKLAMYLTNIDTSIDTNVIFSRLKPVPVARDKKTKNQIDTIITDILHGKLYTLLSEFDIRDIAENAKALETVQLTDVRDSQYIQYLIHAYDSIFSRAMMYMGLGTTDNGKQAQITVDELSRNDIVSLLNPEIWYQSRKKPLENAGLTFDYSDIMKARRRDNEIEEVKENENAGKTDNNILSESDNNDSEQSP